MKRKIYILGFIFFWGILICSRTDKGTPALNESPVPNTNQGRTSYAYYVSKTGSDHGTGASISPFLTIQKAVNLVVPGDTIIVRDGEYLAKEANLVYMTRSGTATGYIIVKSEHKWGAILNGNGIGVNGIMIGNGASYIKFIDFEIKNFLAMGYVCNDRNYLSNFITIEGNKIHDIGRFENTQPYGVCGVYIRKKNHHWTIDKNLIYDIGRTGPDSCYLNKDHAIYTGATDSPASAAHDIAITYNVMYSVSGATLNLCSINDLIFNNVFAWRNSNSQGTSAFVWTDSNVTGDSFVNNIFYQVPSSNPFAIANSGSVSSWTVKNNMVYGGRMWITDNSDAALAMKGNNYGQRDCEHAQVDPKFVSALLVNSPNEDFSLQSSSPAINAGINVGLTTDILKNSIIGLPDIGAYEYQGNSR